MLSLTSLLKDSDGADRVMFAIQKVAESGTAVICTIHQPSTRIFARASHLLLLKRGYVASSLHRKAEASAMRLVTTNHTGAHA